MRTVTTTEVIADALAARYGWEFFFDPATTPPFATVQGCNRGGADTFSASCPRCWWWNEDDDDRPIFTAAEAQVLADAHNRIHHNDRSRP